MTAGQVCYEPRSDWIQMHLGTDTDVTILASLVSIAIQAATGPRAAPRAVAHARGAHSPVRFRGRHQAALRVAAPGR